MEGPKVGPRKMSEQAPSTAGIEVGGEREASPAQMRAMKFIKMHNPNAGGGTSEIIVVNPRAYGPRKDPRAAPFRYVKASKQEIDRAMMSMQAAGNAGDVQQALMSLVNHRDAQDMTAQQFAQRTGQAKQPAARRQAGPNVYQGQPKQAPADWQLESADSPGSMARKQPVKQGGPVSKTASVRSGKQNDEPKPTAQVGKPKKKEKRSMDANPAPVKDVKGGDNEHKKMGMHEGMKELEKLLNRKIDTTFLK